MRFLPVLMMIVAGACISIQGPINARLRLATESPVLSAAISFLTGGLLLLVLVASGAFGGTGAGLRGLQTAPPWAFCGGALGILFVLGSILAIPQAGSVVVICSAIVGQMLSSYLIDTFGLLGVDKVPFSWVRLSGIAFLAVGVLLVQRK
ncbi:MAG TPA: DMT family transporter [Chthoniobacterales bacterium]